MIARRYPTWMRLVPLAVALGTMTLLGCARSPAPTWPTENILVVALTNAPIQIDPRLGTDQASGRLFELMLNGLVSKDPLGNIIPDLAESWELLDDQTRYRFHLRSGVKFHSGKPLTSADVVWTFQSILDGTVPTPKRGSLTEVERVEAIDAQTVDFVLSRAYGALLVNLDAFLGIVPAGVEPKEFSHSPDGTGPFRLVKRTPDRLELVAYDGYIDGRPSLDRIILREIPDATVRALEIRKGTVQLLVNGLPPDLVPGFRADPAFAVHESPGSNYSYIGVNMEDPILSNRKVREAIAHALDRQRLVATLWRGLGVVTDTLLPPGHWARDEELELIPHDKETAGKLLNDAGFPDPDGEGPEPRFTLTFKTSTDETALLQAQIIQTMLAEVGIGIEIRSYEFATFYSDIKRGSFQLFSLTWTGIVDPDFYAYILHSERMPPAGANRGRFRNAEFDRLVDLGASLASPQERRPYYLDAQRILMRELPYISLFTKINVAVLPAELEGYENYLSGEFYSLRRVRWNRIPQQQAKTSASR